MEISCSPHLKFGTKFLYGILKQELRVTSSNPQVTSSNLRVTSSNLQVRSSNSRVQILEVRVRIRIEFQVHFTTYKKVYFHY